METRVVTLLSVALHYGERREPAAETQSKESPHLYIYIFLPLSLSLCRKLFRELVHVTRVHFRTDNVRSRA